VSSGIMQREAQKMGEYPRGSHTITDIQYHVVWTTKYRYKILTEKVAERLRELLRQGCEARGITIISGSISGDHVHMLIGCPPSRVCRRARLCSI
jgi:putative transposase